MKKSSIMRMRILTVSWWKLVENGAKKYSSQKMIQHTFGNIGLIYLIIIQFLFPLFAMIGYTIIVGQQIIVTDI